MEKKVLSFKQFLYEDVTDAEKKDQVVDTSNSVDSSFSKPETERVELPRDIHWRESIFLY